MIRVVCQIYPIKQPNERGVLIDSLVAICPGCHCCTTSLGTSDASMRRCLWLMKGKCLCVGSKWNFYIGFLPEPEPPTDPGFFGVHDEPDKPKSNPPHWTDRL
jgi:hypothetical protein